ncbi:MAG: histidine phosphatase family protein [Rhodospirillales bacterium]|jgi:phosphohistidine phosphatase|nr:histidine phosphatase family protein [Rhodospirillales bacterium]
MHQLLLLRHAKSVREEAGLADRDRSLAPRGRRDAAAMRAAMRRLGLVPDLVLLSPSRRTRETLAGLEPWDDTPLVETLEQLYLADAAGLEAALAEVPETVRSVLLIGHNPGLHLLARTLVGGSRGDAARDAAGRLAERYPTGALAEFVIPGPWHHLDGARLIRFLTPEDLAPDQTRA